MPVGAPPSVETLERLRPRVVELVDASPGLCPLGGRLVTKDKVGGFMVRRVLHWVETGEYPTVAIKPECGVPFCVDCGRLVLDTEPGPAPAVVEPIAPPPPLPAPVSPPVPASASGVPVERVGWGGPERSSGALVPVPVPGGVPRRRRPGLGVVRRVWPVAVLAAAAAVMALAWSAVATVVSPLEDELPQGDVVAVEMAPVGGQ